MTGRVEPLAGLAPSVLRQALLDGPAGEDPAGRALVGLLDRAGLLARPEVTTRVLEVGEVDQDGRLVWADLDLTALGWCAYGLDPQDQEPVELDEGTQRLLAAMVALVDLAAELVELDDPCRRLAIGAVAYVLGHAPYAVPGAALETGPAAGGGAR